MGSEDKYDDKKSVHQVRITQTFYMGKYEVTQAQWESVMGNNPSDFKGPNLPVEQVSYEDVQTFIRRLNQREGGTQYRQPTEAGWEYACRAGTTTPFYFGRTITTDQVNYDGNYPYNNGPRGIYRENKMPAGSFAPNAFWAVRHARQRVGVVFGLVRLGLL